MLRRTLHTICLGLMLPSFNLLHAATRFPLQLTLTQLEGIKSLKVNVSKEGVVQVMKYPESWMGRLALQQFPNTGMIKELSDSSCFEVKNQAALAANLPAMAQQRLAQTLRTLTPVIVRIDVASALQTNVLLEATRKALIEQGADLPNLQLKNPLDLSKVRFRIDLADDAITKNLGDVGTLENMANVQFTGSIARVGYGVGEISALDLLCDLNSGKATLTAKLEGQVVDGAQFRLLAPVDLAQTLVRALSDQRPKFNDGVQREDYGRNRILAGTIAEPTLRGVWTPKVPDDFATLIERLTDSQTGIPLDLGADEISERMKIFETGGLAYAGEATVSLIDNTNGGVHESKR